MTEKTEAPTLASALAEFQKNLPTITKGNTARIPGKDGRTGYTYEYADLTDVSAAVLPALAAQGLAWLTAIDTGESGNIVLRWSLIHGMSGESVSGTVPVGRAGEQWQSLGSAITYARRYALVAVSGVAPGGDDNDGADAKAGTAPVRSQERPVPPRQASQAQRPTAPNPTPPAGAQPSNGGMLPAGLYDLSQIVTADDARLIYKAAQRAGHLGLIIGDTDTATGEQIEIKFGDWLEMTGTALAAAEFDAAQGVTA